MKARRRVTPPPHRWVLALLTVLASFAFLARQPEPGMPSGMGMAGLSAMPGMVAERADRTAPPGPDAGTTRAAPHSDLQSARADAGGHAALLATSAPNAPPTAHDHSAHCPFCFTAAFALEAAGVALPVDSAARMVWDGTGYTHPALLVLGLSRARAPPLG